MTRLVRRDRSHAPIKQALLDVRRPLMDVSHLRGLGCDLIVEHVDGSLVLMEIKNPGPPSARKLTASETALRAMFPDSFVIVQTPVEALLAVGVAAF